MISLMLHDIKSIEAAPIDERKRDNGEVYYLRSIEITNDVGGYEQQISISLFSSDKKSISFEV